MDVFSGEFLFFSFIALVSIVAVILPEITPHFAETSY
jgi:hypothetical protein